MTKEIARRFTVISTNKEETLNKEVVTNPISYEAQYLREKLAKFRNNEGDKKYSVKDFLTW